MKRIYANGYFVPAALLLFGALPISVAVLRLFQIPMGTLPPDSIKMVVVPVAHFSHVLAGATFGLLGPLQLTARLRSARPHLHRILGRIHVLAGLFLALSGLRLVTTFPDSATMVLDAARILGSVALLCTLWLAISAIRRRDINRHRAWMIRGYAIGMGGNAVVLGMILYLILIGSEPVGLTGDIVFVVSWAISILVAEWLVRRNPRRHVAAHTAVAAR